MEQEHHNALVSLLGATYAGLKKLDDSIVGSSSTLNRRSDDVKKELGNVLKGTMAKPDVPILQAMQNMQPQMPQVTIPQQAFQFTPPPPPPPPKVDDGQMEFNLDKKANYDDVLIELNTIYSKLGKLEEKMDKILKLYSEPKKKDPGLTV